MTLARISVTIARSLVAAADRRARELDRSRSWVVSEALRQYLGVGVTTELGHATRSVRAVREPPAPPYAASEVAEARRRHVVAELALSPGERLRRAEELGRLAREAQHRATRHQVIGFDTYEDYYEWKKTRLVGG